MYLHYYTYISQIPTVKEIRRFSFYKWKHRATKPVSKPNTNRKKLAVYFILKPPSLFCVISTTPLGLSRLQFHVTWPVKLWFSVAKFFKRHLMGRTATLTCTVRRSILRTALGRLQTHAQTSESVGPCHYSVRWQGFMGFSFQSIMPALFVRKNCLLTN